MSRRPLRHARVAFSFNFTICLDSPTILDKNVEKNGRYHVYVQDKALVSTGNYKYSPFLPQ